MAIRSLCALAGVAILAACSPRLEREALMFRHFGELREIRDAAVFGRLEDGRRAALGLRFDYFAPDLPPGSGPYLDVVRERAADVGRAEDPDELAGAAASLASSCGACHVAFDAGPVFGAGMRPEPSGLHGHMEVHAWATARMWEALIEGGGDGWKAGADALSGDPIAQEEFEGAVTDHETAFFLSTRVHELAQRAPGLEDHDGRSGLVGELWATCSRCHGLAGLR